MQKELELRAEETKLPGVTIIEPTVFGDERGYFFESFSQKRYNEILKSNYSFVQDNVSFSRKGILRGLHIQHPHSQGKLVQVLQGEVFDVAVDVRIDSPTFGQYASVILSDKSRKQLMIPPGFAHGFLVLSEEALFNYKCTDYYHPDNETSIRWNDPQIAIDWPMKEPFLSQKDKQAVSLDEAVERKLLPLISDYQ